MPSGASSASHAPASKSGVSQAPVSQSASSQIRSLQFRKLVAIKGGELYRDLPWRRTRDPYAVLVSEVMLQQTQVSRVIPRFQSWLDEYPTVDALAAAPAQQVLASWQGMGYNRRALALKHAAEECSTRHAGCVPSAKEDLLALPGVGPSTAAGVRIFAFEMPDIYIETNVRAVVIHELFPDAQDVPDSAIAPILAQACDPGDPRSWYYAMLDYGAWLKKAFPNPSRRSRSYARQSAFEGSRRQKRAWLLRALLEGPAYSSELAERLSEAEAKSGRMAVSQEDVESILVELAQDGFIACENDAWRVRS